MDALEKIGRSKYISTKIEDKDIIESIKKGNLKARTIIEFLLANEFVIDTRVLDFSKSKEENLVKLSIADLRIFTTNKTSKNIKKAYIEVTDGNYYIICEI